MTNASEQRNRPSWRLRVYPIALLATLAAALVFATAVYDEAHPTSRLGGDYPAFYAAGNIALEGDWDELYSDERQQAEQAGLIDDEGGFLYFSYPPFVAAAYAPLSAIDYRWSFLLHTVLMGVALFASIKLLWPWIEDRDWPVMAVFAVALASYPLLRAVPGGQNTALSLLLLAAAVRFDRADRPFLAGLVLAMLLFKPQFGVVLLPLMFVARRWRIVGGWLVGAAGLYAVSAVLMGGAWVADWWSQAGTFRDVNVEANGFNFISVPGFVENILSVDSTWAVVIGYGLAAVIGVAVAHYWWRNPHADPLRRFALAAAAVVVVAPQTLFYDGGLLLLGVVALLPFISSRSVLFFTGLIGLSWLGVLADRLGWSPLGPLSWLFTGLLLWNLAYVATRPVRTGM
jgi:hypothetical protein